jgi:hypothetical protein
MNCLTCDELLAEYKLWAILFKDAVLNIPGALGEDSTVFAEHAEYVRLKCKDAGRALAAHWRNDHSLARKARFSEAPDS